MNIKDCLLLILVVFFQVKIEAQNFIPRTDLLNGATFGQDVLFGAGGISFMDFNEDGWDDITISTAYGDSLIFFVNNQGTLEQIPALVDYTEDARQILWVDYDNDDDLDLFVATFFGHNSLYQNDGNLNFTNVTTQVGLGFINDLTIGGSFGDIDNDGDLDLYVTNHPYDSFQPYTTNFLYLNNNGVFDNITPTSNTGDSLKLSFGSAIADFNNDGWTDIYVANDREPYFNALLINLMDLSFVDKATDSEVYGLNTHSMNVGVADFDYDKDLDIYVTNLQQEANRLYVNNGIAHFTDQADMLGLIHEKDSWGGSFLDIDNDMGLDLFVSSGYVTASSVIGDTSFYYLKQGLENSFQKFEVQYDSINNIFANTHGDINNDGLLEVLVATHTPQKMAICENVSPNIYNWVKVKLHGTTSNSRGINSWIEIYSGPDYMTRYTLCGESFQAQPSDKVHFGMANHTIIDSLKVTWLSGIVDTYYDLDVNQLHNLTEGETIDTSSDDFIASKSSISIFPNPSTQLSYTLKNQDLLSFSYRLLNAEGKQIMVGQEIMNAQDSNFNLETSHLSKGIYFLEIQFEDGSSITKKWICKK